MTAEQIALYVSDWASRCQNSEARLSGATAKSVFNSKSRKQFGNINRPWGMMVPMGEWPSQRDVSSDVSNRLDYCNSLLYGIADIDLTRLQRVQNQLAHLVTKSVLFTRSIPLLRSLHWLPVRFRILFKTNLLTYKTLREKQPVYLHSMLAASIPSHSLRLNNDNRLSVRRDKINTGARAFHSCAPSLWNNLPLSVHSASSVATFKRYLKTHLFDLAFPP